MIYTGIRAGKRRVFNSDTEPTQASHGHIYDAVIGPFKTKAAAFLMAQPFNQFQTVADAEKQAAKLKGIMESMRKKREADDANISAILDRIHANTGSNDDDLYG